MKYSIIDMYISKMSGWLYHSERQIAKSVVTCSKSRGMGYHDIRNFESNVEYATESIVSFWNGSLLCQPLPLSFVSWRC